jgi:hypothetical protein
MKKGYQKPTMSVIKLHHTGMLMTSGVKASRSGYETAAPQTWGDEGQGG